MFGRPTRNVDSTKRANSWSSSRRMQTEVAASQLISPIRDLARSLQTASAEQLRAEVHQVRCELARGCSTSEPHLLVAGLALASEALRRTIQVSLYDVQLLAAISMSGRCIAQMQTGEGKTLVAVTVALHLALAGRGVHVVTPNAYLAERDEAMACRVAKPLGLTVALLPERCDAEQKIPAYDADITYGTGHEFGFDYLRDQVTLRQQSQERLGERLLRQLQPDTSSRRLTMQRGLVHAVIDEADSVLIDDAGSPLILSMGMDEGAPDAEAHRTAKALAEVLQPDQDFLLEASRGHVVLTKTGILRCHAADVAIPVMQLVRPWTEYVQQALRARYVFRRNVHYVVQDDEVRIVDETTGRIFEDRSWQDGLHQAIEASQGLPISAEKTAIAQVTRQRFFRLYEHLSGMTGTAVGCERELQEVYRLTVEDIPLRVPSRRIHEPPRFFATLEARTAAIAMDAVARQQQGRAILIGTRSISDSELLAQKLTQLGAEFQLLNGLQNADEAAIISRAGQRGAITIATNLAGRGTDILLAPEVRERGGLHVVVAECQTSSRMDRQLIGRCARQGDPGSSQVFASSEDTLIVLYGPWLASTLRREADPCGEVHSDFTAQLQRIQATAERQQYAARINMLRRDLDRDAILRRLR